MKKLLTFFLISSLFVGFSQSNDDLRSGSSTKKGSSSTSNGSSSSSSGGGLTANDINLIINACGCLYDVALPFFTEVVVKGVQANTKLIEERRDSFPRIKNMELNLGYGFYPEPFAYVVPKLRLQAGVMGTSFRGFVRLDRTNPFNADALAYYDWQMLEFNVLNVPHATLRFGGGFMFDPTSRNKNNIYEPGDLQIYGDITGGADLFFNRDKIRWNIEGRFTPFGEVKARKEVNSRLFLRPSDRDKFHFEVFGGGTYAQFFDRVNIWYVEAGAGFMIY